MRPALALFLIGLGCQTTGLAQPTILESKALRLEFQPTDASIRLLDKRSNVVWKVGAPQVVLDDGKVRQVHVEGGLIKTEDSLAYTSAFGEFQMRLANDRTSVEYRFGGEFQPKTGPRIKEVRLFQNSLAVGPGEGNYYAVPQRMGILLRTTDDQPAHRRLGYSSGCSMAFLGAVQDGSALLLSWDTPEATLLIDHEIHPRPHLGAGVALHEAEPLGRLPAAGDEAATSSGQSLSPDRPPAAVCSRRWPKRSRPIPRSRSFSERPISNPSSFPASSPRLPGTDTDQEIVHLGFTFDEAAQLAGHLKNDLGTRSVHAGPGRLDQSGLRQPASGHLAGGSRAGWKCRSGRLSRRVKAHGMALRPPRQLPGPLP